MEFRALVGLPYAFLIFFPLSILRDMSAFRYAAMLSLLSLTYTGIVLTVELPFYHKEYIQKDNVQYPAFCFDWNFPVACSMVFFAFTCQL